MHVDKKYPSTTRIAGIVLRSYIPNSGYQRAFKAKKILESTPPDNDDIHIMMEIYGQEILIGPGKSMGTGFQGVLCCEVRYDKKEDFWEAYNEIGKEAQSYHTEGPYPWAAILGLVVDKFGIGWALYYNE